MPGAGVVLLSKFLQKMERLFKHILVPVDFSTETLFLVHKAVELAQEYSCRIQLLHVSPDRWLNALTTSVDDLIAQLDHPGEDYLTQQMLALIEHIRQISNGTIQADYSLQKGKWDQQIVDTIENLACDLILLAQPESSRSEKKIYVDPVMIAERTDVPVITVPFGRRLTHIYSLLIPVTDFLPLRKLMYGAYIASKSQASLNLLGVESPGSRGKTRHFLKESYQLIHDTSTVYVSIGLTEAGSVAEALDALARDIATDLILVSPKEQTSMPGTFFQPGGKTLPDSAAAPVLIINPI